MQLRLTSEGGTVLVRYSRTWGLACLIFVLVLAGRVAEGGGASGTAFSEVCLAILGALALAAAWFFLRARPVLIVDRSGLVFCRAGIRLEWAEIASVSIQEWQSPFDLSRRLVVEAVHPERLEELWHGAPRTFGLMPPRDGRIALMLNFLALRSKGTADAICECSGGRFAPQLSRVARGALETTRC